MSKKKTFSIAIPVTASCTWQKVPASKTAIWRLVKLKEYFATLQWLQDHDKSEDAEQ